MPWLATARASSFLFTFYFQTATMGWNYYFSWPIDNVVIRIFWQIKILQGGDMPIMGDKERELVKKGLAGLTGAVTLINFTQEFECGYCKETSQIITEVAALSDKIDSKIYDFASDKDAVAKFNIEQIPATVVMGAEDYGIRFYGIPSGYEFTSLLESIRLVSAGNSGLSPKTKETLSRLKDPLKLEVLVTPT
jgi:glutaredoxin-like protein